MKQANLIKNLPACTLEEQQRIFTEAKDFIRATGFHSSSSSTAVAAVAEYIAYLSGKCLIRGQ